MSIREDAVTMTRRMVARRITHGFSIARVPVVPLGDIISTEIIVQGYFEKKTLECLRRLLGLNPAYAEGRIMIDVGANIGNHTLYFADLFDTVYAFEPNPLTFRILEANILLSESPAIAVPLALSDQAAWRSLGFSGNNLGWASLNGGRGQNRYCEVETATFDAWLARETIDPAAIGLVKVDVEGHEIEVFTGMTGFLARHDPLLVFETSSSSDPAPLVTFLRNHGFSWFYELERPMDRQAGWGRLLDMLRHGSSRQPYPSALEGRKFREMVVAAKTGLWLA